MSAHRYLEENGSAAMLAPKRSAGVAPEVNLRDHVRHIPPPSVNKAALSGFVDVTRSPKRLSVAPQKGLSSKIKF